MFKYFNANVLCKKAVLCYRESWRMLIFKKTKRQKDKKTKRQKDKKTKRQKDKKNKHFCSCKKIIEGGAINRCA